MTNPFDVYKLLENEKFRTRKLKVNKTVFSGLNELLENYLLNMSKANSMFKNSRTKKDIIDLYHTMYRNLEDIDYSINDIEEFCLRLGDGSNGTRKFDISEYTSVYLSALISNIAKHNDIINLDFTHIGKELPYIGCFLHSAPTLLVKGDIGDAPGFFMFDHGARIVIDGNARNGIGCNMLSGEIIVHGNAGKAVGYEMHGGKIYLEGDYASLSKKIVNGEIYHKGKRIWSR